MQGLGPPKEVARAELVVGVAAGAMGQVAERVGASPPTAGALGGEKGRQGWIPCTLPSQSFRLLPINNQACPSSLHSSTSERCSQPFPGLFWGAPSQPTLHPNTPPDEKEFFSYYPSAPSTPPPLHLLCCPCSSFRDPA